MRYYVEKVARSPTTEFRFRSDLRRICRRFRVVWHRNGRFADGITFRVGPWPHGLARRGQQRRVLPSRDGRMRGVRLAWLCFRQPYTLDWLLALTGGRGTRCRVLPCSVRVEMGRCAHKYDGWVRSVRLGVLPLAQPSGCGGSP